MTPRHFSLLLIIAALVGMLTACGSSSGPLSVQFASAPPAAMKAGTNVSLTADIVNGPQTGNINWTASCSTSGQCGSFSSPTTQSGQPTTYTAPVNIPSGGVTIEAAFQNANVSATINITSTGALPDGNYVFQVTGEDADIDPITLVPGVPYTMAGAFTVKSGSINQVDADFVDPVIGGGILPISAGTSSITSTSDGNLQIGLDAGTFFGSPLVLLLNVTLTSPTSGLMNEFDNFATGSGTLTQQTSAAQTPPTKGYAFLTSGWDSRLFPIAMGGIINVDGAGSISGAGSVFDINDTFNQGIAQDVGFSPSTVLGPDALGRVEFTLNPVATSNVPQVVLIGYIVDSSRIVLVEGSDLLVGTTGGIAYSQGNNTGGFSNTSASIAGASYAVGAQGGEANLFLQLAGSFAFAANGTVSGNVTFNDVATQASGEVSGNYTADSTGRVTVTGLTGAGISGSATLEFYVDGNGNAVAASMDSSDVTAGPAFQQTSGAVISGSYALGALGFGNNGVWSAVGPVTVTTGNIVTGGSPPTSFTDFNYLEAAISVSFTDAPVPLSGTMASGTSTITGLGADALAASGTSGSNTFFFYPIDNNRAWGIESDNVQLGLLFTQLQQ